MSCRALMLAAVMFLIGGFGAFRAEAENLDAGKSPSQLFAGTCSECHKSSRGLLKRVPAASLAGFLRQHYTTGGEMASVLSAYLISNGAADRRLSGGQAKPGADAGSDAGPRQAARRPDGGASSSPQLERGARKRLAHCSSPSNSSTSSVFARSSRDRSATRCGYPKAQSPSRRPGTACSMRGRRSSTASPASRRRWPCADWHRLAIPFSGA